MNINKLKLIITLYARSLSFPARFYLFGSHARGNQTSESDIDIAVEPLIPGLDTISRRNQVYDIENNLRDLLHKVTGLPIHVVFYDGNPTTRKGRDITTEGYVLYSPANASLDHDKENN
jgi:predicted nucleotidyltransferase